MTQSYRPGYERAAEGILEFIARERLAPGDRLPTEVELSKLLGVSRTVTREAVRSLATLGRLTARKGAGIFVAPGKPAPDDETFHLFLPADVAQVYELFELRAAVEQQASELAALRAAPLEIRQIRAATEACVAAAAADDFAAFHEADERFHRSVAAAAHNRFLESVIATVTHLRRQVVAIGLRGAGSGSLTAAAEQHHAVLAAISDGEPAASGAAMRRHIEVSLEQFQREIQRRLFPEAAAEPEGV